MAIRVAIELTDRIHLQSTEIQKVGSVLTSRPTLLRVLRASVVKGFRHFYHHGGTENTENALIQSQIRTLLKAGSLVG
jgi:hypothetical protein